LIAASKWSGLRVSTKIISMPYRLNVSRFKNE
jgi:hypothetical protein